MDIKVLRQIITGIWLMEPNAARQWAEVADKVITGKISMEDAKYEVVAGLPGKSDTRRMYPYQMFKVNEQGFMDNKGTVQVMMMDMPIMKYDYCGSAGSMSMGHSIMAANADPSVDSIVLYMDSPGGSVDGTESLANIVKQSKKPVVAYVNSMMASAAYWIGSGASMIMSDGSNKGHNAVIGSIGTMASWVDKKGMMEKMGATVHEVYATESTDKNGDFRAANAGDYSSLIQDTLDPLNETFLSAVKENRMAKINLDKENVLSGKTYNAKDALKYGLIDKIGSFEQAVSQSLSLAKKYKKMEMQTSAFTKTLTASGSESFEVVDNGFLLSEEQLNNIETRITDLQAANDLAVDANNQLTENGNQHIAELERVRAENALLLSATTELQSRLDTLNAATVVPTSTAKSADHFSDNPEDKYLTSVDREAAKLRAMRAVV